MEILNVQQWIELFDVIYTSVGVAGLALIGFAIYGLYLGLRNIIYIRLVRREFRKNYRDVLRHAKVGTEQAQHIRDNPLLSIVWDVVQTHQGHSDDLRAEVNYLFHKNFESVNRSLYWIRLITVVSPLLGLLGTVMGMVGVFQAIATDSSPDATVLAAGIWEALLTTIMGLSIAIPMLMIYYFLLLRFKGFRVEAIEYSYRAVGVWKKRHHDSHEGA